MKRRDFLAAASLSLAAPAAALAKQAGGQREYFELRRYQMLNRSTQRTFKDFARDALIPALNRAGVERVGVFNVLYGASAPTLYLLLVHRSLESVATTTQRLSDDSRFRIRVLFFNAPETERLIYVFLYSCLFQQNVQDGALNDSGRHRRNYDRPRFLLRVFRRFRPSARWTEYEGVLR